MNADGKEGWVPSNHLCPMTDEDREMLTTSGESTPADNRSGGEAADNSGLSDDDGKFNARLIVIGSEKRVYMCMRVQRYLYINAILGGYTKNLERLETEFFRTSEPSLSEL